MNKPMRVLAAATAAVVTAAMFVVALIQAGPAGAVTSPPRSLGLLFDTLDGSHNDITTATGWGTSYANNQLASEAVFHFGSQTTSAPLSTANPGVALPFGGVRIPYSHVSDVVTG